MPEEFPPHDYIPAGPLETAPGGGFRDPQVRREAFAAVLAGVETGAYGQRVIDWLCDLDDPTCRTVAYLLWQARLAGRAEALPAGTFTGTQWAVRYSDQRGVLETAPYDDEADAREHTQGISPPLTATVVSRRRWWTRWTEAPETTEVTEQEDGDDG